MSANQCKISHGGNMLKFTDKTGDMLEVDIYSTGETVIRIRGDRDTVDAAALLTNRAAHELRDFLNRRFPNATAVQ
jgi:hypothetical protein